MSPRSASLMLAAALSAAAPLAVAAGPASAAPKYKKCSGTANHGDQRAISVRVVTCKNAINFLELISKKAPTSTKQDGSVTVATLKYNGWTCTVRVPKPDPSAKKSTPAKGQCTAKKSKAIKWTASH